MIRAYSSLCWEIVFREFGYNANDMLQYIVCIKRNSMEGVTQHPLYIPTVERSREKITDFIWLVDPVSRELTILKALLKHVSIFGVEVRPDYKIIAKDSKEDTRDGWNL